MRPCREVPVHFAAGSKQREQCGERLFIPRSLQTFEALRGEKIRRPKVKLNSRPQFFWSDFFLIIFKYKKSQNKNVYFGRNFQQNMFFFVCFFPGYSTFDRNLQPRALRPRPHSARRPHPFPFDNDSSFRFLFHERFDNRTVRPSSFRVVRLR